MLVFHDHRASFAAFELSDRRLGDLTVFTEIRVKGNHRAGPVPVQIKHSFRFSYQDSWTDPEGNEITGISRAFDSPHERNMYITNHFEVQGEWKAFVGSFGGWPAV